MRFVVDFRGLQLEAKGVRSSSTLMVHPRKSVTSAFNTTRAAILAGP
jgi:hypothetical protein